MVAHRPPGLADYLLLIALALIWGGSFALIKIAVVDLPAITMTAVRLLIGAVSLAVVAAIAGQTLVPSRRLLFGILAAGLFGNALPFTLISWGEEVIESGLAAILMAVMPLTTVLLAHLFTGDERLNARKLMGVGFGLAGLIVLIGPDKLASLGNETIRQLAVAAAAFCYGINAIITKRLLKAQPIALGAAIVTASAIMLMPLSLAFDTPLTLRPGASAIMATVALGLFQTALATLIMFALIGRQGASFFSQINFLVPLAGVFYGVMFLSERPSANAFVALGIILAGISIARGGISRSSHESK